MDRKSRVKFLSLLICFTLVAVCVPMRPLAEQTPYAGECGENATWTFEPDTALLTIEGAGEVTSAEWLGFRDQIKHVKIGDGITVLANSMFDSYPALETAELADSITDLGINCFRWCEKLTTVNLPANLKSMRTTFMNCTSLTGLFVIPDSVETYSTPFYGTAVSTLVLPSGLKNLGEMCCAKMFGLKTLVLRTGIEKLGSNALQETSIQTLIVPDTVTELGREMCWGCKELSDVFLPDTIEKIPFNAFGGQCLALNYVRLPAGLREIEPYAFNGTENLKSITLPATLAHIGESAFYRSGLKEIRFTGTEEQWNAITIDPTTDEYYDPSLDALKTAEIVFNAPAEDAFMCGDANGDREITAADARLALRAAVGLETYAEGSAIQMIYDVDLDGLVTASDARRTLRVAVGLEKF